MFKRLLTSLTKPPRLIFFMKDSWKRIILYILILPFMLVIPSIIKFAIQPTMSIEEFHALSQVLKTDFNLDGETITDGVFSTSIAETAQYGYFQITTTKTALTPYSMTFLFDDEAIVLYMGNMIYESQTYEELGIDNYVFNFDDTTNLRMLTAAIRQVHDMQTFTIYMELIATYTLNLIDYLLTVMLLAFIAYFMIPNQLFPFKMRFKLSVYASTIYIFSQLILLLIGYGELTFISIIIAYVYHLWIYRSIKILPKGVPPHGDIQ